jgi:type I restriction enzyme S subunit
MSQFDDLVQRLCAEGTTFRPLGDLVDYQQPGKYLVDSTDYSHSNPTPVLTAGQTFILGYTDETKGIYSASPESPVIIFDDFTTAFKWVDFPFKAKSSAMKMLTAKHTDVAILRYIHYAMQTLRYTPQDHARQWIGTYSRFSIPVPPLEVQREIVRILDKFTQLEAELEAELEARRRQYAQYSANLLDLVDYPGHTLLRVDEICKVNRGVVISKDYLRDHPGPFPVYSSQTASEGVFGYIDTFAFDDEESITWTTDGANAGSVFYHHNKKFTITNVCGRLVVRNSAVLVRYLYFQLTYRAKAYVNAGMGNPKLMANHMSAVRIPVPMVDEQRRIVSLLDKFDALVNDLSIGLPAELAARRKQYEHYRDRLLTFQEAAV